MFQGFLVKGGYFFTNTPSLLLSWQFSRLRSHQHPKVRIDQKEIIKEIDYQIQIRIIEARQLSGMQLDPVTTVTVGNQKKHTAVKEQTNTPFWDEV